MSVAVHIWEQRPGRWIAACPAIGAAASGATRTEALAHMRIEGRLSFGRSWRSKAFIVDSSPPSREQGWWEFEAILRLARRLQELADEFKCETCIGTVGQSACSVHATLRESCAYVSRWGAPPPVSVDPAPQIQHRCRWVVSCSDGCGRMHVIYLNEPLS